MNWLSFFPLFGLSFFGTGNCGGEEEKVIQLRRDGMYNAYDTSMTNCGLSTFQTSVTYSPLIFVNDSLVFYTYSSVGRDSSQLYARFYTSNYNDIGRYHIGDDRIIRTQIVIGLFIRGMRMRRRLVHFEGIIKNRDTILNWHMVPPYPDAPAKFNNGFKDLLQPKLLYFIESKELLGLDSLYQVRLQQAAQNPKPKKHLRLR